MASARICSVPGCGKAHYGKGLCNPHWWRFRKYGDPLAGATQQGEPLRFLREIAFLHDGDECLTWPFAKNSNGYGCVRIGDRLQRVHRLVCEHEHGPAPTPRHEAAHSCGKGHEACCNRHHLSWKTPEENALDKIRHGTHSRGERGSSTKLTRSEVLEIRALKVSPLTLREVSDAYGVSTSLVDLIQKGKRWAWL